jgi:Dyp-type peroxidase family
MRRQLPDTWRNVRNGQGLKEAKMLDDVDHTDHPNTAPTRQETLENVQAHLLRASKFKIANEQVVTKNWSLFLFFRILTQAEFDATMQRMKSAMTEGTGAQQKLWQDFADPAILNAGLVEQCSADDASSAPDRPAHAFQDWLKAIVSADKSGIESTANILINLPNVASTGPDRAQPATIGFDWENPTAWIATQFRSKTLETRILQELLGIYANQNDYLSRVRSLNGSIGNIIPDGQLGPLPVVALYELMRQCAPAMASLNPAPSPGIVRAEPSAAEDFGNWADATPINIAFTYSGLAALKMNDITLASFPDAFKQGMAGRAPQLHDTGPSAPDTWDGELGLPSVHGYFTGGFPLDKGNAAKESFWKLMRRDVKAFNDPVDDVGKMLRFWLRLLFRLFGLEILHIELGQDPYTVDENTGTVVNSEQRLEHFGFRDGLSQPFVDMGLGDTLPGGGTPSRDRTWTPVAPGEIFLDQPDEDGETQSLPISRKLTVGGTFLVFRKLEQDVAGFRAFLGRRRPKDREAQKALSAQFVGRWPNGVPLVLSPDDESAVDPQEEATLNDFRYAADDPRGEKCPLGAHIRRANPRDIGGRGDVRRHRILRRSISYGGPLLKDGTLNDGETRGLLFVAANSRIDLQFEVIQASWINGAEFLGQAGLGRCPLIGDHNGAVSDSFLEAGASAPVTGLPRFVTTRGGDYFFAPGIEALREIANGGRFDPEKGELPFAGFSMGDAKTPNLFDLDRLQLYGQTILQNDQKTAIHITLPGSVDRLCFIGRYADVASVLKDEIQPGQLAFSVRQYTLNGRNITRGRDFIIGTEDSGPTKSARERLHVILNNAWQVLADAHAKVGIANVVRDIAKSASDDALRRTAPGRRLDLVNDLASQATFAIIAELYGIPAPDFLTELGAALPFAHQHVGELPPDWIATLLGKEPDNPGLATMQIWSAIILADLIGNVQSLEALHALSRQAGSEMLDYLDAILLSVRTSKIQSPMTLVGAFVTNESRPEVEALYAGCNPSAGEDWRSFYYRDVSTIFLEIVGTSMATIPLTFASVMGALLKLRIDLPTLMKLPGLNVSNIIYEAERLNPNLGVRMRYCETDATLPSGAKIKQGEWVVSLIGSANLDGRIFSEPFLFKLDRKRETYLLFNEAQNERVCWGRDRIAMAVLQECVIAASRLQGLRSIAGKDGEPSKLVGVTIRLPARFTQVAP